jgi:hypothetical protein
MMGIDVHHARSVPKERALFLFDVQNGGTNSFERAGHPLNVELFIEFSETLGILFPHICEFDVNSYSPISNCVP